MPLKKGSSRKTISANIHELTLANKGKKQKRSRKQIIAIALNQARRGTTKSKAK